MNYGVGPTLEREDIHVHLRHSWTTELIIELKYEHIARLQMITYRAMRC